MLLLFYLEPKAGKGVVKGIRKGNGRGKRENSFNYEDASSHFIQNYSESFYSTFFVLNTLYTILIY